MNFLVWSAQKYITVEPGQHYLELYNDGLEKIKYDIYISIFFQAKDKWRQGKLESFCLSFVIIENMEKRKGQSCEIEADWDKNINR